MRFKRTFLLLTLVFLAGPAGAGEAPSSGGRYHLPDDQLGALIDVLLSEHPAIRAVTARSMSVAARVDQAAAFPDPQLNYRWFAETPETRVGPQQHMVEISQAIPGRGKRALQARGAERAAAGISAEADALANELVASLKRKYYQAAYLEEALTVNREERELLQRFEAIALKRYATGKGIQQSVVKVQTEVSRSIDRETDLRRQLNATVRSIAELIGRPDRPLELAPIELTLPELAYDAAAIEEAALAAHPGVHAIERRIESDRIRGDRQALETKPDFRVGLGYTLVGDRDDPAGRLNPPPDNGQDVLALSFGVNIPVHRKRIRAGVAEMRESERAGAEQLSAARNRIRFELQEAFLQIDAVGERARLYGDVIIPQARESLASAETAYTADRLGFLDLLEAERVLFQSRLAYHRLVADLWIAAADIERAAAQPFPAQD